MKHACLLICLWALPAVATAAAQMDGPDPDLPVGAAPLYQLGRSLIQQGELEGARVYLDRAFRLAPRVERIASTYLDVLVATGHAGDALTVATRLVERQPDIGGYRRRFAVLLAQGGHYRKALDQIAAARARGLDDIELLKLEVDIQENLSGADRALAIAANAAERFPDDRDDLAMMRAGILRRAGREPEVIATLSEELQRQPEARSIRLALLQELAKDGDLPMALNVAREGDELATSTTAPIDGAGPSGDDELGFRQQLAEMLGRQGRFAEAASVLESLLASGGASLDAQLWLARLLLGLDRVDDALALLPGVAARWPESGEAQYLWGKALLGARRPQDALPHLRRGVELAPDRADIRLTLLQNLVVNNRAQLAKGSTDPLRAEVLAQADAAAGMVSPEDATGQLILGYTYRALGRLEEAARAFGGAAEINDVRLQAALELAFCWQDLGQTAKVSALLEDLRREFPEEPEVANSLGYYLAEQGRDLKRAQSLVEEALRSDPRNGAFLDSLGWVHFQQGDFARAFDVLVEAVNQRPDDPTILEHLGLTLQAMGDEGRALDVLRSSLAAGGDAERLRPVIEALERDAR